MNGNKHEAHTTIRFDDGILDLFSSDDFVFLVIHAMHPSHLEDGGRFPIQGVAAGKVNPVSDYFFRDRLTYCVYGVDHECYAAPLHEAVCLQTALMAAEAINSKFNISIIID